MVEQVVKIVDHCIFAL